MDIHLIMSKELYLALAAALDDFIESVNATLKDHALTQKREHLEKIAKGVTRLNDRSLEVLKSHDKDVEDVGAIIQDILNQPITNGSPKQTTSMLKSSKHPESDLAHVMANYIKYSHATLRLIQELELLSEELKENAA